MALITATGLAVNAVLIRSGDRDLCLSWVKVVLHYLHFLLKVVH